MNNTNDTMTAYTNGNPKIDKEAKIKLLNHGEQKPLNPWSNDVCKVPSRHLLVGASETGKSMAVFAFLLHERNPYVYPFGKTYYLIHPTSKGQIKIENSREYLNKISREYDPSYESLTVIVSKNIVSNVPEIMKAVDTCQEEKLNFLLIIDDAYGTDTVKSPFLVELYVKGRHKNISVMFLTQVAMSNKIMKDIRRNINYLWIFQSYEEDVDSLLKQIISTRKKEDRAKVFNAYVAATSAADYGYIVYSPFIKNNKIRVNDFFLDEFKPKTILELEKDIKANDCSDSSSEREEPLDDQDLDIITRNYEDIISLTNKLMLLKYKRL